MGVSASVSNLTVNSIDKTVYVSFNPANPAVAASFSGSVAVYFDPSVPNINVANSPTVVANAGTGTLTVRLDPGYTLGNVLVTNTPTVTANAGTGTMTVKTDPGYTLGSVGLNAGTNNIGDVDVLTLPALVAGTANIGDVDVLTLPALPTGSNTIGAVTLSGNLTGVTNTVGVFFDRANPSVSIGGASSSIGIFFDRGNPAMNITSIAAGDTNIGNVDVVTLPALVAGTANIGDVDIVSGTLTSITNTIAVYFDRGNPTVTANIGTGTARVFYDALADYVSGVATLTATADTAVIVAGGTGIRNYITSISASNTSATNVRVDFKDGTTIMASFFVAASGGGATHTMPVPLRGTANTAFNAALSAAVTDVRVSAQGYRAP
jgi:hypothetical protein